jgi:hypothetical protein
MLHNFASPDAVCSKNRAIGGWTRTFTNPAADNFIESRVSALAASPSLKWKNSSGPMKE